MNKLTKFVTIFITAISLVACAAPHVANKTSKQDILKKIEQVSADKLIDECQNPVEIHNLSERKLNKSVNFARHHNCMGIGEMIVVAWPGNLSDAMLHSVRQLAFGWGDWMAGQLGGKVNITVTELKIDSVLWEGRNINVIFYEVTRKPKK